MAGHRKKEMVRMFFNMGAMDIEVHCDVVPRKAMNFLLLAERGEYKGSKFHRSIPNLINDRLTHTGPVIVSHCHPSACSSGHWPRPD